MLVYLISVDLIKILATLCCEIGKIRRQARFNNLIIVQGEEKKRKRIDDLEEKRKKNSIVNLKLFSFD